uniref:Thioredoxin-like fold domain-containing protein n=1 Tax=Odontella aurita TaxID=265563 RepID=A0A7S4JZ89_9STRA|mmetsp:Transcript_57161/g.170396  ORF Transcript_57161/g.170396 Transcript_57161/m.170396 type:complete len:311 (+) Transcript_57161:301-1233(+)
MRSINVIIPTLALAFGPFASAFVPSSLAGTTVKSVKTGDDVDLATFLSESPSSDDKTMLIMGTYAADFNAVEYAQRLRYYLPKLQECGVGKVGFVLNCEADAAKKLAELVDLETTDTSEASPVELLVDPLGEAGRKFGVGRGWLPDNEDTSPYLKLFGMLWGLGAWATLPAVIGGYIGNPFVAQPWIEDALAVGQKKKRWPDTALEIDETTGDVKVNKFSELPYVGSWERRPLELATLRLQNMIDISIKNWKELAPNGDALEAGVLTQLGGCVIVDSSGNSVFEWKDPGICAVANFENILKKISAQVDEK